MITNKFEVRYIPMSAYHADMALSRSFLHNMLRSPAHAMIERMEPESSTPDMLEGEALHTAVLDGHDEYCRKYYLLPKVDLRTTVGKATKAALDAANPHAVPLPEKSWRAVDGMYKSMRDHSIMGDLLSDEHAAENEMSIFWRNADVECKARVDRYLYTQGIAIDLKKCQDARKRPFMKAITDHGYHFQAAWYLEALLAAGFKAKRFLFFAVESSPPYGAQVWELDDGLVDVARQEIKELFLMYKQCQSTNNWPAYPEKIQRMLCPAYMISGYEE